MSGHYHHLIQRRDAILSTARMSASARALAKGERYFLQPAEPPPPPPPLVEDIPPAPDPVPVPPAVVVAPISIERPNIGRSISIEAVQRVFLDVLRAADYEIEGQHYGRNEMISYRRSRPHSWPRQVCMDLVRRLTPASYPAIGKAFGGKDHTTVMCAIKRTPHHLAESPLLAEVHAKVLSIFEAKQ